MIALPNISVSDETEIEKVKEKLPELLGANNVGKEFWITIPPCYEESAGDNFIKLFITSPYETSVDINIPGKNFNTTRTIQADEVTEVNLNPAIGQPYTKHPNVEEVPEQVYEDAGIHIEAEFPIVVYCVVRYQATSDGFIALPVSSLGTEYIATPYSTDQMFKAVWRMHLPSMCGIVAAYDDTEVSFTLGGSIEGMTAGGLLPGETSTVSMNEGDVYMVSSLGDFGDLSGSRIEATKPVAVVSGVQCTNIPVGNQWCDYTVEMEIPTFTWGTHYHVPKVPNRKYAPIIRIFAKEASTTIYRDNVQIGYLESAGGLKNEGFIETRLTPGSEDPRSAIIHADKPIAVTLYNTGVQEDGLPAPNSDPFCMTITPISQYQKEILFSTPGLNGSGFSENYINVVFQSNSSGEIPDDLQFAKQENGVFNWVKVSELFGEDTELFDFAYNDIYYAMKTLGLIREGIYRMRSDTPFAAYSFGYASYDSYGYPTSAALKDVGCKDQIPPVPIFNVDCAGNVYGDGPNNMAIVNDQIDPEQNSSKLSLINLDAASKNYEMNIDDFIAGEDEITYWDLKSKDKYEDASAYVTFCDRNGNNTTIAVVYESPRIDIRTNDKPFTDLQADEIQTNRYYIYNESEKNPLEIARIELLDKTNGFTMNIPGISLPYTIHPLDSIPVDITFSSSRQGAFVDFLEIENNCGIEKQIRINAIVDQPSSVNSGNLTYDFPEIAPNPVVSNSINVTFSIAIVDWTELTIYDNMGKIVAIPLSKVLSAGSYDIPVSVANLNSGAYYIVLKSGSFTQERKIIINK